MFVKMRRLGANTNAAFFALLAHISLAARISAADTSRGPQDAARSPTELGATRLWSICSGHAATHRQGGALGKLAATGWWAHVTDAARTTHRFCVADPSTTKECQARMPRFVVPVLLPPVGAARLVPVPCMQCEGTRRRDLVDR